MSIGIDKTPSERRQAEINRQIEEYLKRGNKITQLPSEVPPGKRPPTKVRLDRFGEELMDTYLTNGSISLTLH